MSTVNLFRSVEVRNFQCLQDLAVTDLRRINLITGRNNVGKTTLLEALFLLCGPNVPELTLKLLSFRGIEHFRKDPEQIWGSFFHARRTQQPIEVRAERADKSWESVKIELRDSSDLEPVRVDRGDPRSDRTFLTTGHNKDLVLHYSNSSGEEGTSRAYLTSEGLRADRAVLSDRPTSVFLGTHVRFPTEDAERFSGLEGANKHEPVVEALRIVEPRLRRLSVLVTGGAAMLHGDIGLSHLVPVPLMGEGVVRLLSILLAVASAQQGVVLIDEIETGFHHLLLSRVWRAVAEAARAAKAQLLATTHSWECVRAAHDGVDQKAEEFRLHRLERTDDRIRAVTYEDDAFDAAVAAEMEVR